MSIRSIGLGALLTASFSVLNVQAACVNTLERDAPDARYELDGAVATDKHTHLMWLRCPQGQQWQDDTGRCGLHPENNKQTYTWGEALTVAQDAQAAGYDDWRLPNKNELASLVDLGCSGPALNANVFKSTVGNVWSSTPWRREAGKAWQVDFKTGSLLSQDIDHLYMVRLVRDNHSQP